MKKQLHFVWMVLAAVFCLTACQASPVGKTVESEDTGFPPLALAGGEASLGEKEDLSALPPKERIARIIASERETLLDELEKEMNADPHYAMPLEEESEAYQAYEKLFMEREEVLAAQEKDPADDDLQKREKELSEAMEKADPDGQLAEKLAKRIAAKTDYGVYAYYNAENSPYKEGFDTENIYPFNDNALEAIASYRWPMSLRWFANAVCVTGHVISTFEVPDEEGPAMTCGVFEISECYAGAFEKGDRLILAPRMLSEALREELWKGDEWMILLGCDEQTVEHEGKEETTWSTMSHAYFRVEDGRVQSISKYYDFQQYNGMTPEELTLALLRIRVKYAAYEA